MADEKTPAPQSAPTATPADTKAVPAPGSTDAAKTAAKGNGKIWMGTAVGIGSAAIVAALLYTKRRS
ncbi:hypothetical protein PX699_20780 [Sphingobium sp. H39-3-25]|uniref:hypothetical protein n=1 Tax=Sphingobium arseniciresistens TaxID=3030834 RepID=UPI0023B8B722|nr:hypothetical protein [Sphingobium arseniciresistens]